MRAYINHVHDDEYVIVEGDKTLFALPESGLLGEFSEEEMEVIKRQAALGDCNAIIEIELKIGADWKFDFDMHFVSKQLSCGHLVGMNETGTACGCWSCPICKAFGSCNGNVFLPTIDIHTT